MKKPSGAWCLAVGCVIPMSAMALPTDPPISPMPVTRYEYDAMGKVTRILRGEGRQATTITYDRLDRITSITDAAQGVTRFEYKGGMPYLAKVIDPRGLETIYDFNGLGDLERLISPDTGTTEFSYEVPGMMATALDSRGVLTRFSHDAVGRLTRVEHSKAGQRGSVRTWTYSETEPGFGFGVGRLTSTTHDVGRSRYGYDAWGEMVRQVQWVDAAPGANARTIRLQVDYGYTLGDLSSITYPSGRKLVMNLDKGRVLALSLARDVDAEAVPLISGIEWGPFGASLAGWRWHTNAGLVAHRRSFDLAGRMTRYPIGSVVRDLRYDGQDRIASFTHQLPDGRSQPLLDQQFGYDANDRLTSIVTSTSTSAIAYDLNGNRASLSLNGSPSIYETQPTSNRLQRVTNPERSFTYDDAGNVTEDSSGLAASFDLEGQLVAMVREGITTTYGYDTAGQRIRKASSRGPQDTVLYVYDKDAHLLGEYDGEGRAVREYVWLHDVPIAVLTTNPGDTGGEPTVWHVHADHLNVPREILDRDGNTRWRWLSEPFGSAAPNADPTGRGVFHFDMRMPGQMADQESGLFYNWSRYYDARDGRYTQADPLGQAGGSSAYPYAEGNPVSLTDPSGEFALLGAALGALGNLGWQLWRHGGDLRCVDPWEIASWALAGSGTGIFGRYAARGLLSRTFWNPNFRNFSAPYWNGQAFKQWYGIGNLDHWLISASAARRSGILKGLGNAGWNLLEIPAAVNQAMGMRGWMSPAAQVALRIGVSASVPGAAAVGGGLGHTIGTRMHENCECGR